MNLRCDASARALVRSRALGVGAALAVCALALAPAVCGTSEPPQLAARAPLYSRAAASGVARELLAAVPLPPGARRGAAAPAIAGRLGRPLNSHDQAKTVDRHEYWTATARPFGLLAFLARHGAARRVRYSGYGGVRGRITEWAETLEAPVADPLAGPREVFVAIVPAGRGRYAVRVDALVAWHRRRPPDSLVPAAARRLTVETRIASAHRGRVSRTRSLTTASSAMVRAVARAVDALALAEPAGPQPSCPAMRIGSGTRAPLITLTFRGARGAAILAQVRTSGAFVCARAGEAVAWITAERVPQVALTDHLDTVTEVRGSSLIERLQAALGQRLRLA